VTPGFGKVPLLRWPSVTSASGARGGYSPVDRRNAPCISVRECNSTTRPSFLASPPLGRPHRRWGYCPSLLLRRGSLPEGSQEFSRSLEMIRRSNGPIYSRPLRKNSAGPFSRRSRPCRIQTPRRRTGQPPRTGRWPSLLSVQRHRLVRPLDFRTIPETCSATGISEGTPEEFDGRPPAL